MEGKLNQASPLDQNPKKRISPQSRRHNEMRRQALAAHPDLKTLNGAQPLTVLALPVLLAVHWGLAWMVSGGGFVTVFLVAFVFGQIVIHATGSLVHETAHRLIFRGAGAKLAFDLGLEVILGSYSKQLTYQHEHITSHHPFVGDYERDYEYEDICAFQARQILKAKNPRLQRCMTLLTLVLHALPLGFLIGDEILPRLSRILSKHPVQDPQRHVGASRPPVWYVRLFIGVSLASNLLLLLILGPWALLYHIWALSLFLGKLGISNLGQSLAEHQDSEDFDPTRSTYGWINALLFNTGYHNEHHTFPNVPWTRLPQLKAAAPDVFHRTAEYSYFGYWWRHVKNDFSASRHTPIQDQDNRARCAGQPTPNQR